MENNYSYVIIDFVFISRVYLDAIANEKFMKRAEARKQTDLYSSISLYRSPANTGPSPNNRRQFWRRYS